MSPYMYSKQIPSFGTINIRKFTIEEDIYLLHDWVNREYAYFWGLQNTSVATVMDEYKKLLSIHEYEIHIGYLEDTPAFILEAYTPQQDVVAEHYDFDETCRGVHILLAPHGPTKIAHFSWYMFTTMLEYEFLLHPHIQQLVIEPDIRNKKMFALCERIGFQLDKVIELPHKTAQLAFLQRSTLERINQQQKIIKRTVMNAIDNTVTPQQSTLAYTLPIWQKANLALIKKALSEFSHERLITIENLATLSQGINRYKVRADNPEISYEFEARLMAMNHYSVKEHTIIKRIKGEKKSLDAVQFIHEFKVQLGIPPQALPVYLEEIISTLNSTVYKLTKEAPNAEELVHENFQVIEQSMNEGHPGFVANNGRIGFDATDYRSYAPEVGNSFSLIWLAGHRSKTVYAAIDELPYNTLIEQELGAADLQKFEQMLRDRGLSIDDYYFIPVHPWQWFNKLAQIFTPEIASNRLICMGYGEDQYVAQQSIRTLFNTTHPQKFYTKTALSILNMGFMRGLPLYYLGTAPKMAKWLEELLYKDPFMQQNGFKMLSEIGSVSYVYDHFETFGPHNDYNKMLASLWRESPYQSIKANQEVMTMAALLHLDAKGNPFIPQLIHASGLYPQQWVKQYIEAYLIPLVHCFYQYDLVFMPHGENIILVMEDHVPVSIFMKDITEEACILGDEIQLPEHLQRMRADVPEDVKLLSIFTDIFDGFFRFLAPILDESGLLPENKFWEIVAQSIIEYQDKFPDKEAKYKQYDLFGPQFKLSCLNRLQLQNHKQMIDLDDPVALLQFAGTLTNPLAAYQPQENSLI